MEFLGIAAPFGQLIVQFRFGKAHGVYLCDRNMKRFQYILGPILVVLAMGCSDSATAPSTPPPPPPPVTYTDPPQYGTPFSGVPELKDVVLYEVNLRAFSASGTFAGVTARLDSIKAMGVNTIWLMPIYPVGILNSVGQLGSPYSVRNYKEVNTEFGTLDDLRMLVDQAHAKGMAVILDWVANHTAWDNPWIVNTTWYTTNSSGAIIIPPGTNWNDVADLNYSSTAMRRAMINAMKYWVLAANIDGYRCDYADGVPFDFWKQSIDSLKAIPSRQLIMLAEGASTSHFTAGFQLNYAWNFYGSLIEVFKNGQPAAQLVTTQITEYSSLPASAAKLRFTTNHDETAWNDTPLGLFGGKPGSMAAYTLVVTMGGNPLIYNGQEVGCPVKLPFFSKSSIDWSTNPDMKSAYKKLIAFRQSSEAIKQGTFEGFPDADIVAFRRTLNASTVVVLVNTRNSTINYNLPGALANTSWTDALTGTPVSLSTSIGFAPYEIGRAHV